MSKGRTLGQLGVCVVAAISVVGCGAHRAAAPSMPPPAAESRKSESPAPPSRTMATTLEASDARLSFALLRLAAISDAASHRGVAREYRRLGVLDKAHEHFSRAVAIEKTDAASYEALARIWRDWGTPHLGLADAHRAVFYAPDSPAAANTLGTVLHRLHRIDAAMDWYARAITLDPAAWYAMNNLCYAQVITGQAMAREACRRAVAAAPDSKVAQNNLALAHTAAGDLTQAQTWFRRAADPAVASYNYGIAMMATRAYEAASAAFYEALDADPQFVLAAQRAKQADVAVARAREETP